MKKILIITIGILSSIFIFLVVGATLYRMVKSSTQFDAATDKQEALANINQLFLMSKDNSVVPNHLYAQQGGGEWWAFTEYNDKYLKQILSIGSVSEKRMIYPQKEIKDKYDAGKQKYIMHIINDKEILDPPEWWVNVNKLERFEYYRIQVPEDKYIITFIVHDLKNKMLYCFRCRL